MDLQNFLEQKGQEYAPFDPRRAGRIFEAILDSETSEISQSCAFNYLSSAKFIHLIGTNGKGSTGRFCALVLMQQGYKVLHFTSPHLFKFNERFFGNVFLDSQNSDVSDEELERAHNFLQKFGQISKSSYFEYATFLALVLAKNADFVVFEAGLGGEFDSTSSVIAKMIERKILKPENILSVFTPIGIDHADFLGENIENIAATKLRAMSKNAILAPQKFAQTTSIARQIAKDLGAKLFEISESKNFLNSEILDSENELEKYAKKHNLAPFLKQNLITAFFALKYFKISINFQNLPALNLRGRCEIIKNVLLDVGHNAECANALSAAIQAFGFENATLIYNTYADKNAEQILKILKPFVKNVLILKVENPRIMQTQNLRQILKNLEIEFADFEPEGFKNDEKYIVFGSFSVVLEFLSLDLVQ